MSKKTKKQIKKTAQARLEQPIIKHEPIEAVIDCKHYSTGAGQLIAGALENQVAPDEPKALFRGENGNYFLVFQGRGDYIMPIDQKEALSLWGESYQNIIFVQQRKTFQEAFPNIPVTEA